MALLNLDPVLDELRNNIQDPEYVRGLVRERLLDNPHRVRLTMVPDSELSARRDQAEAERLADMKARLSDEEKQRYQDSIAFRLCPFPDRFPDTRV